MIKAYKFGLLEPVSGFDQSALDVLFLRNKLWNNLVALEREHREQYRAAILDASPALQAMQDKMNALEEKRQELITQKKKMRSMVRSKKVDTSLLDVEIQKIMEEKSSLKEPLKTLRDEVKMMTREKTKEIDKERYEAVKKLCHESGLWWANYETVIASYDVARVRAMKENAELRFKSFDGSGKFAVRESGGFSKQELFSGAKSFIKIEALPDEQFSHLSERGKKHRARHLLTMTAYTYLDDAGKRQRHQIMWPIVFHRDLPEGQIKVFHVQRKRIGNQFEWSCSITMEVPEEPKSIHDHASKKACGVDIGFRGVKGGLRIATIADGDKTEHILLPQDWLDKMDYVERLQSEISEEGNNTWEKLKACLGSMPEYPESLKERIHNLLKAGDKTPYKGMKALLHVLRTDPVIPEALDILEAWDKAIYRPYKTMNNLRDKLQNRRQHIYRNLAYRLSNEYSLVRMEDMDLRKMSIVKTEDGSDNELHQRARDNRKRAALYSLVLSVKQACAKTGAYFELMPAAYSTMTCSSCGHVNEPVEDIHFYCKKCGTVHDQDENAAKNFLSGDYINVQKQIVA